MVHVEFLLLLPASKAWAYIDANACLTVTKFSNNLRLEIHRWHIQGRFKHYHLLRLRLSKSIHHGTVMPHLTGVTKLKRCDHGNRFSPCVQGIQDDGAIGHDKQITWVHRSNSFGPQPASALRGSHLLSSHIVSPNSLYRHQNQAHATLIPCIVVKHMICKVRVKVTIFDG
jgi:hypothetical protein